MDIIVFCTGKVADKILSNTLKSGNRILFLCDNDKEKWGTYKYGYEIMNPQIIKDTSFDKILLATATGCAIETIMLQLAQMGVTEEKCIFAHGYFVMDYFESALDEVFDIPKKEFIPFKKGPAEIYENYVGETFKSHERRKREGFFEKYCQGEGLDIGYGADIIVPGCSGWDLRNGDAQYLVGVEDESFDFVYSSHCLEHMENVGIALKNWFRVVKNGGFLILAIPHRDLYEKKDCLPSRWNIDHKHMFLIGKEEKPDTLDIVKVIKENLNNYDIQYVKVCDEGHTITDPMKHSDGEYQIEMVIKKVG